MGTDKAFVGVGGVPLWRRQLQTLEDLSPQEIFLAGPPHPEWQEADCIIIPDAGPNAGPLAGIVAALQRCSAPLLLVIAIDLPNITTDYLRQLLDWCASETGVAPASPDRFEPLAAVYPRRALPLAQSCLASRELSLQRFAARCVAEGLIVQKEITPDERPLFLNMNTPEDLMMLTDV